MRKCSYGRRGGKKGWYRRESNVRGGKKDNKEIVTNGLLEGDGKSFRITQEKEGWRGKVIRSEKSEKRRKGWASNEGFEGDNVMFWKGIRERLVKGKNKEVMEIGYRLALIPKINQIMLDKVGVDMNKLFHKISVLKKWERGGKEKKEGELGRDDESEMLERKVEDCFKVRSYIDGNMEEGDKEKYGRILEDIMRILVKERRRQEKDGVVTSGELKKVVMEKEEKEGLILLPTDKTRKLVFMSKEDVSEVVRIEHGEDKEMYLEIGEKERRKRWKDVEKVVAKVGRKMKGKQGWASLNFFKKVEEGESRLRIYVKDHKRMNEKGRWPTRPVIYGREASEYKMAVMIEKILKKSLKRVGKAFRGCEEVVEEVLMNARRRKVVELVKVDVKSLFPSIDQRDCLVKVKKFLQDEKVGEECRGLGIEVGDLMDMIEKVVVEPIVKIGERFYKQIRGLMIGSPAALPLAEVYLEMLERGGEEMGLDRKIFSRYVDDSVFLVEEGRRNEVEKWRDAYKPLEMVIEEEGRKVNFLNSTLEIKEKGLSSTWYRKEEAKGSFLNDKSNVSRKVKRSVIMEQIRVVRRMVEDEEEEKNKLGELKEMLKKVGYNMKWVEGLEKEVRLEDGIGEKHLWGVRWKEIAREVKKLWNEEISFIKRKEVKGDGWCMMRAVLDIEDVVKLKEEAGGIRDFMREKIGNYGAFLNEDWEREMEDYIERKKWGSGVVDLLPKVMSDKLGKSIMVISFKRKEIENVSVFNEELGKGLVIAKENDHYWRLECEGDKKKDKLDRVRPTVVLPYVNPQVVGRIKERIGREGLECNVSFKCVKLYDLMRSQSSMKEEEEMLEMKGVVYRLICEECRREGKKVDYIGETGRKMKVRLKEHGRITGNVIGITEVGRHMREVHKGFREEYLGVEILERERDEFGRKVKEAVWIQKERPTLNVSKGLSVIGMEWIKGKKKVLVQRD